MTDRSDFLMIRDVDPEHYQRAVILRPLGFRPALGFSRSRHDHPGWSEAWAACLTKARD